MMIATNFALPQINDFIGGDSRELIFTVTNEEKRPLDVSSMSMLFSLIESGNKFGSPILEKKCFPALNGEHQVTCDFKVKLEPKDTAGLAGKFIYQLSVADHQGDVRTGQGVLIINKNINEKGTLSQSKNSSHFAVSQLNG